MSSLKNFTRRNSSELMKHLKQSQTSPFPHIYRYERDSDRYQRKISNPFAFELAPTDYISLQQLQSREGKILDKLEQERKEKHCSNQDENKKQGENESSEKCGVGEIGKEKNAGSEQKQS